MTPEQLLHEIKLITSPTVTIEQAAEILGVSTKTVSNYFHAGKLGAFKPAGRLYFDREELERFKMNNRIKSNLEIESQAATFTFKKKSA